MAPHVTGLRRISGVDSPMDLMDDVGFASSRDDRDDDQRCLRESQPALGSVHEPPINAMRAVGEHCECDRLGVPWFHAPAKDVDEGSLRHRPFVHTFYLNRIVAESGSGYVTQMQDGQAVYETIFDPEKKKYPPAIYDRRLTLNNWKDEITMCLLDAGLRLCALQQTLQMGITMFENSAYEDVPIEIRLLYASCFLVAVMLWVLLGLNQAACYRDFIHPDSRSREMLALFSSTLLLLFAVPNDITLCPVYLLPYDQGGLLKESSCILGNRKWPVFTISYMSRHDHDYTNHAGLFVQLPLFLLVDLACTALNVTISMKVGIFNYTALLQMSTCGAYAFLKLRAAFNRFRLQQHLFATWRQTACDKHMSEVRRTHAKQKYLAEGGDLEKLRECLGGAGFDPEVGLQTTPSLARGRASQWFRRTRRDSRASCVGLDASMPTFACAGDGARGLQRCMSVESSVFDFDVTCLSPDVITEVDVQTVLGFDNSVSV